MEKKQLPRWLDVIFKDDKRARIIVILGVLGMALILMSSFFDGEVKQEAEGFSSHRDYAASLETQFKELLEGVDGVGETTVMVTLEGSGQYIYAQDVNASVDETTEYQDEIQKSTTKTEETKSQYIFVDSGADRHALKLKELEPQVKGVVVVCQGAASAVTRTRITEALTTSLGLGASQVCVLEAKKPD